MRGKNSAVQAAAFVLLILATTRAEINLNEIGVSMNQQTANYYYGALAPLDQYAQPIAPRLINGQPYNGQFAQNAASAFGNPSGVFPTYGGVANNYLGGPGSNGLWCDPRVMACTCPPGCAIPCLIANGTTGGSAGSGSGSCAVADNINNGFGVSSAANTCPCNNVYNPVCSNNGVTYSNYCRAKCHGVTVVTPGPCFSFNYVATCNTTCSCSDTTDLVCSPRGVTYENACVAKCAGINSVTQRQCPPPCNCQYSYAPVCSKSGKNFVNLCYLNCAGEELLYKGPCASFNGTADACLSCDNTYSPVCGMDGVTYRNPCLLTCKNTTTIRYHGECPVYNNGACICNNTYLPVCSADGTTFDNYCKLFCAGKTFAYMGSCQAPGSSGVNGYNPTCLQNCANSGWSPLCGSDGLTYGNQCAMTCKLSGAVNPVMAGPCNPTVNSFCQCASEINLVCGADGKTYLNPCQLNCVSVKQKGVGPCDAIGSYGNLLAWFQQNGIGSNFVNPNGYSILQDPHIFIPGPFDPNANMPRPKPRSNYDDDSDSGYGSNDPSRKPRRRPMPSDDESSGRRRPSGPGGSAVPTSFTLIGANKK